MPRNDLPKELDPQYDDFWSDAYDSTPFDVFDDERVLIASVIASLSLWALGLWKLVDLIGGAL
jgi:hypothetical protein